MDVGTARTEVKESAYKILTEKSKGRRPLGRPSSRWVDNIKEHVKEIGYEDVINVTRIGTSCELL
jgi:hypothetical protein